MKPRRMTVLASAVLVLVSTPVSAQLLSPVGNPDQARAGAGAPSAAPGIAVPEASPAPFSPARIDAPLPEADPAPQARTPSASADLPAPLTSEFETYVSTIVGKPLRRFGAEIGRAYV